MNMLIKKVIISFIFIFLICFNLNAAVVTDNDGAAFITKAEFDSLKNNFQTQIDKYNMSIDSKIDAAIASYLAGIKTESQTNFTGFVEVKSSDKYIYGRRKNYGGILKQMWNDAVYAFVSWGFSLTYEGGINLKPFYNIINNGTTYYDNYTLHCQTLNDIYDYGVKGYVFNDNGVVTAIYNDDNIKIVGSTFGASDFGGGAVYSYVFQKDGFNNQTRVLNTTYTDWTSTNGRYYRADYTYDSGHAPYTLAYLKSIINQVICTNDKSQIDSGWWSQMNLQFLHENYSENITFYHSKGKEDKTLNIYNVCDIPIYAYKSGETVLETFSDVVDNNSFIDPSTSAKYPLDVSKYSYDNQLIINKDDTWDGHKAIAIGYQRQGTGNEYKDASRMSYMFPKIKLKNTTSVNSLKPVVTGKGESTAKFNNLYQFKNGLMPYLDKDGNTDYPTYYGGIPLFTRAESGEVKFKIKFEGTAGRKIMLQVKKYEFPNGYYSPTSAWWTATNPESSKRYIDELVVLKSDTNKTNTEKYLVVDLNTETTITIDSVDAKTPYFLRFSELNGTTDTGEGGTIVYLSDFVIKTAT